MSLYSREEVCPDCIHVTYCTQCDAMEACDQDYTFDILTGECDKKETIMKNT